MDKKRDNPSTKVLFLGIGGSGQQIVAMMQHMYPLMTTALFDTDKQALEGHAEDKSVLLGPSITKGLSAGGDDELARQATEKSDGHIRSVIDGYDLIFLVAGLGGGTASGSVPVVARIAKQMGIRLLVMVTRPFPFEGQRREEIADKAIKRTRAHADTIIQIPYHRLFAESNPDEIDALEIFKRGQKLLVDAASMVWSICAHKAYCSLDYASLQTLMRDCDGFCHFASAFASGTHRANQAVDALMHHPLMKKGLVWENTAGILLTISADSSLTLLEIESIMDALHQKMEEGAWINFGMHCDEPTEGIRLSILTTEAWSEPLVSAAAQRGQGTLGLEEIKRDTYFDAIEATVAQEEDLDIPTYHRKNIKLPR